MSKAYLLVICLFFASLSGCITDDELEDKSPSIQDDDMIEPVGTGNNETDDYDELIAEIQNLTNEIAELRLEIEEMKSSRYDAPENSNFTINDYDEWYGEGDQLNWKITPMYRYIKEGHTLIIEYLGPEPSGYNTNWDFNETELYCYDHFPYLDVYNADGVIIDSLGDNYGDYADGNYEIENLCENNYVDNGDYEDFNGFDYWSRITKTFDEEPVRIGLEGMSGTVYTFQ